MLKEWQDQRLTGVFLDLFDCLFVKKEVLTGRADQHGDSRFTNNSRNIYSINLAKPRMTGLIFGKFLFIPLEAVFY